MKIQADWLNDYISGEKLSARQIADRLEHAGIEVEQIISSPQLDKRIIVGLTTKVTQHPNADRLKLVDLSLGKAKISVVCGAPNVDVGQKVAVAQVGTVLPDGMKIKASDIRGQKSNGMICSAQELGMGDDHTGIMVLDPSLPIGKSLCDIVDSGEILDFTTAANRSDLQSVIGLSREVAAQGTGKLKLVVKLPAGKTDNSLVGGVELKLVPRYMVAKVAIGG